MGSVLKKGVVHVLVSKGAEGTLLPACQSSNLKCSHCAHLLSETYPTHVKGRVGCPSATPTVYCIRILLPCLSHVLCPQRPDRGSGGMKEGQTCTQQSQNQEGCVPSDGAAPICNDQGSQHVYWTLHRERRGLVLVEDLFRHAVSGCSHGGRGSSSC